MDELGLFTAALGLSGPWRVTRSELDIERAQLDLYLGCERGARFACPAKDCAHGSCPVHDTLGKTWRHLDFFQHKAFLHVRLPRVRCPQHGVRQVSVPWARPGSGFTLLFEALVLSFAAAMPMAKVAAMTREHDTRIWRVVEHHVHAARDQLDCTGVTRVGMDETSARKGQDYVSIFADLDVRRVVFATEGRCAETVARFAADLAEHGGDPEKVTDTSSDMSTAFISGIAQHLPNATMTFDRYHGRQAQRGYRRRAPPGGRHPPGTPAHPLAMAEELGEPLGDTTPRAAPLDVPSAQLATARARRWREDFQAF
jgi:transposase